MEEHAGSPLHPVQQFISTTNHNGGRPPAHPRDQEEDDDDHAGRAAAEVVLHISRSWAAGIGLCRMKFLLTNSQAFNDAVFAYAEPLGGFEDVAGLGARLTRSYVFALPSDWGDDPFTPLASALCADPTLTNRACVAGAPSLLAGLPRSLPGPADGGLDVRALVESDNPDAWALAELPPDADDQGCLGRMLGWLQVAAVLKHYSAHHRGVPLVTRFSQHLFVSPYLLRTPGWDKRLREVHRALPTRTPGDAVGVLLQALEADPACSLQQGPVDGGGGGGGGGNTNVQDALALAYRGALIEAHLQMLLGMGAEALQTYLWAAEFISRADLAIKPEYSQNRGLPGGKNTRNGGPDHGRTPNPLRGAVLSPSLIRASYLGVVKMNSMLGRQAAAAAGGGGAVEATMGTRATFPWSRTGEFAMRTVESVLANREGHDAQFDAGDPKLKHAFVDGPYSFACAAVARICVEQAEYAASAVDGGMCCNILSHFQAPFGWLALPDNPEACRADALGAAAAWYVAAAETALPGSPREATMWWCAASTLVRSNTEHPYAQDRQPLASADPAAAEAAMARRDVRVFGPAGDGEDAGNRKVALAVLDWAQHVDDPTQVQLDD
eukprot:g3748.t1